MVQPPYHEPKKERGLTIQVPSKDPDTLFEELLQDLPEETEPMAREFKAFTCAGKIETPLQLLRLVLLYAGLDKPLRTVATTFTLTVPTTSRVGLPLERVIVVGNRWHGLDREVGQGVLGFFERFRTPGDEKRQGSDFL